MNFIQADSLLALAGEVAGDLPKIFRVSDDGFAVAFDIPNELEGIRRGRRKEMPGQRRFAHLSGAGHKDHFSFFRKDAVDFRRKVSHGKAYIYL
jgi:hypothetical protein